MQAVILAGGRGTRLGHLSIDKPKPLVEIAGRPILEHQLLVAKRYDFDRVVLLTGHLGEQIEAHFGDGAHLGLQIRYVREREALGTAGAVSAASELLDDDFLVLYGDTIFDMALDRLWRFHADRRALATLVVHPNDHPYDSDLVEAGADHLVRAMYRKDRPEAGVHRNLVNSGIYVMSRKVLESIPVGHASDFGLDVFPELVRKGLPVAAYNTPEYIKDVGTLDRLAKVQEHLLSGKVARRNLSNARSAVFLDRDGVLTVERGEGQRPEALELIEGAAEAVTRFNASDYVSVVVTNQPGVAKGFITEAELELAHSHMDTLLGAQRAYVDDVYACPHHPEAGFPGERPDLKIACACRKPGIAMIEAAAARYNIDPSLSFMIGDRTVDLEAARRAGLCGILVETGYAGADGKYSAEPDFRCRDLLEASALILENSVLVSAARDLAAKIDPAAMRIAIGGLSRSGKSTLSGLLAWQLRRLGREARIVALDDFLLSPDQRRSAPSVRDRYDYARLSKAVEDADELSIFEGVIALDVPILRDFADLKVGVSIDEAVRKERFLQIYVGRGYDRAAAEALYEARDVEERSVVRESLGAADVLVDVG